MDFSNVEDVKKYIHKITEKCKERKKFQPITDESEYNFLLDLFSKHAKAEEKLCFDGSPKSILYGKNSSYHGKVTHCFYIEQNDGKREEISYLKCLSEVRNQQYSSNKERMKNRYALQESKIVEFVTETIKAFPLSHTQIMQAFIEKFPYKKTRIEQQYCYFKMMLDIAVKNERLEEQILDVCIDKFLQIDADIKTTKRKSIINEPEEIEEKLNVLH